MSARTKGVSARVTEDPVTLVMPSSYLPSFLAAATASSSRAW